MQKRLISLILVLLSTTVLFCLVAGAADSLRGDADADGKVTILDATRIQRYLASLVSEDGLDMQAADADLDGKVSVLDATRIQRVLANLCDIDGKTNEDPADPSTEPDTEPVTEPATQPATEPASEPETEAPVEPSTEPPETPHIFVVNNSNKGAEIQWGAVDEADAYRVFIKNGDGWKILGDTTEPSFTHTDAPYNVECVYTVRCLSVDGKSYISDYDHEGYKNTRLMAPVLKSAKLIDGYVALDWEDAAGAEVYRVYIKGGDYKSWTRVGDTDISYADMPNGIFTSDTVYSFTIRCVDPEDDTRLLSGFDTKGISVHFYDMPEIYYAENTEDGLMLLWTESPGVKKYRIFDNEGSWHTIGDTVDTGTIITGLSENAQYCFTVRGLDAEGNYITAYRTRGFDYVHFSLPLPDNWQSDSLLNDYTKNHTYNLIVSQTKTLGFVEAPEDFEGEPIMLVMLSHTMCYGDKVMRNDFLYSTAQGTLLDLESMLRRNHEKASDYYFKIEIDENEETGDFGYYMFVYPKE